MTWTGSSNAQGYSVIRSLNASTGFAEVYSTTDKIVTSFSDRNLAAYTTYYYKVRTIRPSGFGPDSLVASARTLSAPPTVSISSPVAGTNYTSAQTVTISASATDDVGIGKVEFYDGGVLRGVDSAAPYSYPWPVSSSVNGTHSWTARAYDLDGHITTSGAVSLSVNITPPDLTAPSVPVGVTSAAAGCSQVNLSWSASFDTGGSGISGYKIYRNGTLVGSSTVTSFSSTGLAGSTAYSFTVASYDKAFNLSAQSAASNVTTPACGDTIAPSVPGSLTSTVVSCSQVNLSWSASSDTGGSGLAGYKIYRNGVQVATSATTSYASTGLAASTAYSFRVASYDNAGNTSAQSVVSSATTTVCSDTIAPSIPANVTTSIASCSQVNVFWSASTDTGGSNLAGYKIYRNGVQVGTSATTSFASTGLAASTAYSFRIASYDNAGNTSAQSAASSASTPACTDTTAPSIPAGVTTSVASCSQINVSWSASTDTGGSGLAGYKIYRNGVQVATSSTTSYASTGLVYSTTYSFRVASYDNAGNTSAQSAASSSTTSVCGNQVPVANAGTDKSTTPGIAVTLSGSASSDPDGSIISYAWNFGDSSTGTGISATHTYNTVGTYYVTLTVTDNSGATDTDQAYVDVRPVSGAGQFDWVERFGGTGGDLGYNVAVDNNGDIVLAGSFQNAVSFGGPQLTSAGSDDVFLAKFAADGTIRWSKRFGGTGTDSASDVAVDTNGDIVVVGYYSGTADFGAGQRTSAGNYDIFMAKYDTNGAPLWSKTFGAVDSDTANGVAIDASGNVIVTGVFRWTVNFGLGNITSALYGAADLFIAKYDSDGNPLWAHNYSGPSSDFGKSVAVDSVGNIFVAGGFMGSLNLGGLVLTASGTTSEDFFVARFSPTGQHVWSKRFGAIGTDTAADLAVDGSGNVLVTGQFALTVDFGGGGKSAVGQDVYILKLSGTNGNHMWSKNFTTTGNEVGNAIATDRNGNVLVTGYMDAAADFGSGTVTTAGSADIFVVKLSGSNGAPVWSHRNGGSGFDQGLGITLDGNDKPLVTGYFKNTVDFGGGAVVANGTGADIFLLQFWP